MRLSSFLCNATGHLKEHFFKVSKLCPLFLLIKGSSRVKVSMEHWWNDNDRGKRKYGEKHLSHCQYVDIFLHGLTWDRAQPPRWEVDDLSLKLN
jgi:hypothetical protein